MTHTKLKWPKIVRMPKLSFQWFFNFLFLMSFHGRFFTVLALCVSAFIEFGNQCEFLEKTAIEDIGNITTLLVSIHCTSVHYVQLWPECPQLWKIWSKIFSNKNPDSCILLYEVTLFCNTILGGLFHYFSQIFATISKHALVTLITYR